jgi:hypothetical protein
MIKVIIDTNILVLAALTGRVPEAIILQQILSQIRGNLNYEKSD